MSSRTFQPERFQVQPNRLPPAAVKCDPPTPPPEILIPDDLPLT